MVMEHLRLISFNTYLALCMFIFSFFLISFPAHQTNTIGLQRNSPMDFLLCSVYLDLTFCSTRVFNIVFNTNPWNGGKLITVNGLFCYWPFVNDILYFMCLRQNEKLHLFVGGDCYSLNKNFFCYIWVIQLGSFFSKC